MNTLIKNVRVGESGQIVIPKVMRENMGIVTREVVRLSMEDGAIMISPVKRSLAELGRRMVKEIGLKKGEKLVMGSELYDQIYGEKYKDLLDGI